MTKRAASPSDARHSDVPHRGRQRLGQRGHAGLRAGIAALTALGMVVAVLGARRSLGASAEAEVIPPPVVRTSFADTIDVDRFQRGNLHAHSAKSDGDSPAAVVIAHYREQGYQFLALTDHNQFLDLARYRDSESDRFVLIGGEEVTMAAAGMPVHVNALCTRSVIGGGRFKSRVDALRWAVERIDEQDGVALVNHPNFHYALEVQHIAQVPGAKLLEIHSGHPMVRHQGDADHTSSEQKWDQLLSLGLDYAAVAVDDMHALAERPAARVPKARPGTGWVGVFGGETSREAICDGLRRGRLYASSGVELARLRVSGDELAVWLDDGDAWVEMVSERGEVLDAGHPEPDEKRGDFAARYHLTGSEGYVRARISGSSGGSAWTQAYRVVSR
jgi:hypothetical protein